MGGVVCGEEPGGAGGAVDWVLYLAVDLGGVGGGEGGRV